jgi:hypothetical protein
MAAESINLALSHDEALVLFEFLTRGQEQGNDYSSIVDQAELRVLWDIQAMLESAIDVVTSPDYEASLAEARARVRDEEVKDFGHDDLGARSPIAGIEPGTSGQVFVVLRFDPAPARAEFDVEAQVVGTKAYVSVTDADAEADRLNRLNGPKDATYFVIMARLKWDPRQRPVP